MTHQPRTKATHLPRKTISVPRAVNSSFSRTCHFHFGAPGSKPRALLISSASLCLSCPRTGQTKSRRPPQTAATRSPTQPTAAAPQWRLTLPFKTASFLSRSPIQSSSTSSALNLATSQGGSFLDESASPSVLGVREWRGR
jgi:hypothetical protein